ncbi:hypothetical protein HPB49_009435 [Dermacentor silvarum]|uniref:Uncharacterized protein n=1 Tax=Dermacentor silvarum TaxID=543639 RepID=A0ACB8DYI3_DERSI|nr:hypothetical protein HPB49_009435 [Dermacentor silvarum]
MPGQTTQSLHGSAPAAGTPCCESGRPVLTDPITGQTVCSCQYDAQLLNYQRLAASGLPINMYGTAAAYAGEQGFLPLGAAEQSAFYSPSPHRPYRSRADERYKLGPPSVEDGERDSCSALFGQGARGQLLLSAVSLSPAPSGTDRLPCQAGGAQTPCSEPDSGGRRVVQMNLRRLSAPPIRCSDIAGDLPREEHSRRRRSPFCRNGGEMLPPLRRERRRVGTKPHAAAATTTAQPVSSVAAHDAWRD